MLKLPNQGLNLCPLHGSTVLTTEPPGKSHQSFADSSMPEFRSNCNENAIFKNATEFALSLTERHFPGDSCHYAVLLCFLTPLTFPTYSQVPINRFSSRILFLFPFFFFPGRALFNIALFSKRVLLLFRTTLIKMKANAGVGGTQLNIHSRELRMISIQDPPLFLYLI